jgi:hypothetical protein
MKASQNEPAWFENAREQTIIDLNSGMPRNVFLKTQNMEGNT